MPDLAVHNLSKSYGGTRVLHDVSFEIADGELFTLLGPSGCGKTTTLLAIAGFVEPDSGVITCGATTFFDRAARVGLTTERRDLGMVFQSYAVWPHMTVADNVAFALKLRRLERARIADKIAETLGLVELTDLGKRLAISDGILVLDRGRVQQVGPPEEIYQRPANRFVAGFVGSSNLLDGIVARVTPSSKIEVSIGEHCPRLLVCDATDRAPQAPVSVAIRPEAVRLLGPHPDATPAPGTTNLLDVRVTSCAFLGDHYQYEVAVGDIQLIAKSPHKVSEGAQRVVIDPEACLIVSPDGDGEPKTNEGEEFHA